jgi:hypothetical protein
MKLLKKLFTRSIVLCATDAGVIRATLRARVLGVPMNLGTSSLYAESITLSNTKLDGLLSLGNINEWKIGLSQTNGK